MANKDIHLKVPASGKTACGMGIKKSGRGYNVKLSIYEDEVTCEKCKKAVKQTKK